MNTVDFIESHLRSSNIVEVISAEFDAASGAGKVIVRSLHDKPWTRMFSDLLRATYDQESFGLEIHKVFYAQKTEAVDVRFAWMIMYWGVLSDELASQLVPVLTRRLSAAPPASFASSRQPSAQRPAVPLRAPPAMTPTADDDDPAPGPALVTRGLQSGTHRARHERHVEAGNESYDVYSIPLPHVRGPMYEGKADEVITVASGRSRFKATVQGRGEAEFAPSKRGL